MKSIQYVIPAILTVVAASTVATPAHAWESAFLFADNARHEKQHTSLDRAVTRLRKQGKGRVLSADTWHEGDREEYRIRMLSPDGRVRIFRVDPRSGSDID